MNAPDFEIIWMLFCCVLVLFMQAGFLCMETGLVRTKNAINVALKNFVDLIIAALIFYFIGAMLINGDSMGGFIGFSLDYFNFSTSLPPRQDVKLLFELLFIGTTATIVGGALVERTHFRAYIALAFLVILLIYPPISHWINNPDGWLKKMGAVDLAGATYVHSVGGWVSLAAVIIIGPRLGRFEQEGFDTGNFNFPLSALGVMILWVGWIGFNSGHAGDDIELLTLITVNTVLGGIAGGGVLIVFHMIGHPRGDAATFLFSVIAGLVSITACAHMIDHFEALVIGAIGALLLVGTTILLEKAKIDDGIGVVSTHLVPANWGMLALPLFASNEHVALQGGFPAFMMAQIAAIIATGLWAFILSFVFLKILNQIVPLRVSQQDEAAGLDMSEHGATSEFDFFRRRLEAQLALLSALDAQELQPGTEMGQLLNNISRVLGVFHQRKELWLGQLAQSETTRTMLRTRTSDLEKALILNETGLRRKSEKITEIGGKIAALVTMIEERKKKQLRVMAGVTQMTAVPLKEIAIVNRRANKNGLSVEKVRNFTKAVSDHCDAILSMLQSLELLLEVDLMPLNTREEIVDLKKIAHQVVQQYQKKWRLIEFSIDFTSEQTLMRGEERYLTSMFEALLNSAVTERGTKQAVMCIGVHKRRLKLSIKDDGKFVSEKLHEFIMRPLEVVGKNVPESVMVHTVFLGLTHTIAQLHGGQLNLTMGEGLGLEAEMTLPAYIQRNKLATNP